MVLILDNQIKGPASRFTDSDVLFLLSHISDGKVLGRSRLAEYLGIGEGSARRLLNLLESYGMVQVRQIGVSIRPRGMELLEALDMRVIDINVPRYVLGTCQQGIVVKCASEKVFNGIDQRNAGIRAGGDGCTTWIMDNGSLIMLPSWNLDEHDPQTASMIRRVAAMEDGDVLIVGGADTIHLAMMAAGTAALEIV